MSEQRSVQASSDLMMPAFDSFPLNASGRNNNYDILRFAAASLVILSHSYALTSRTPGLEPLVRVSQGQMDFGHLAVYIFFIVSGFLIAQSYERSSNILVFLWSRALRIYPAFIASLVFSAFFVGAIATKFPLSQYFRDPGTWDYLRSIFFVRIRFYLPGVFDDLPFKNAVNGSLWTIAHEVVCYLIVTIMGMFSILKRKSIVLFIVLSFFYLRLYGSSIPFVSAARIVNSNSKTFLDLAAFFLIGTGYYVYRERVILKTSWAMFCIFALFVSMVYGGFAVCFAVAGSYLIFYFVYHPRIKFWSFARYGDFSYGLYVYAFPVQQLVVWFKHGEITPLENLLYSFPAILVLSFFSWHLLEKQALKIKRYFAFEWFDILIARLNSSREFIIGSIQLPKLLFRRAAWLNFALGFSCLVFFIMKSQERPTTISFPNFAIENLLAGGWQVQSQDEDYRWIRGSGTVELGLPRSAKIVTIDGYVPPYFSEVSEVKTFINNELAVAESIKPGEAIKLSLVIPKRAFAEASLKLGLVFNGVHMPDKDALDQRQLSALITKIAVN